MNKADIKHKSREIATELNETDYRVQKQIQNIITLAGMDLVQEVLDETRRIEAEGGMMTKDGPRRRTRGGVFFHIMRQKVPADIRDRLFPPPKWNKRKAKNKDNSGKQSHSKPDSAPESASVTPDTAAVDASGKAARLARLEEAAEALRERLAKMEAKGQKGVKMTRNLLKQTEQQIEKMRA